jgi:hypothetical protein
MLISLVLMAILLAAGNVAFWHFDPEQPLWRRLIKVVVSLVVTALVWRYYGRLGVSLWFIVILLAFIGVHAIWLPLHGVNGWTGEPRATYHALRGWPPPDPWRRTGARDPAYRTYELQ